MAPVTGVVRIRPFPTSHNPGSIGFVIEGDSAGHWGHPESWHERVAYTGDTRHSELVAQAVRGVDVLIHDSTYLNEDAVLAQERGHSTAAEAGDIARRAGVGYLILTHVSPRYEESQYAQMRDQAERSLGSRKEGAVMVAQDGTYLQVLEGRSIGLTTGAGEGAVKEQLKATKPAEKRGDKRRKR